MRRALWLLLVSVVTVAVLFLAVLPTRTWLGQQRELDAAERRVEVLREQNRALEQRISRLHTDEEIERIAREQHQMVRPGEEAYAILPGSHATTTTVGRPGAPGEGDGGGGDGGDDGDEGVSWWRKAAKAVGRLF